MPEAALIIRRKFQRPESELVKRLSEFPTGWVVDANGRRGAIHFSVKPITRAMRFCGVALTVQTRARDNLAPYAAIQHAQPGDVLMVATGAFEEASVAGDLMLGMAKNKGVVALVTDGLVRDVEGLNAVGVPVFARGLSPNSPYKDGPGSIGMSIAIGGVAVDAGDIVIGDQDGVVVVARESLHSVLTALANVKAKEDKMEKLVGAGATSPPEFDKLLAEKGVQYIDE